MTKPPAQRPEDLTEYVASLRQEHDAIVLYEALGSFEKDARRAEIFRTIAGNDRRHAGIWADRLRALGAEVPPPGRPRTRVRFIILLARLFGTNAVRDLVIGLEGEEARVYAGRPPTHEAEAIAADERAHAEMWHQLGRDASTTGAAAAGAVGATPADAAPDARVARASGETGRSERWHSGGAGNLRAVVFGASDGLVSNLSLVMGVAGATPDPKFILLSGLAGLLAGAFSMAAGEYISVQSQREVLHRQIALQRAEIATIPDEEKEKLVGIYVSKGIPEPDARRIAEKIFEDPEAALLTLVREELGLDPKQIASPWAAAGGSFAAFCLGAIIPVIPYFFGGGNAVFFISFGVSLAALFAVGALVSLLTGRSLLFSGFRQVGLGAVASVVTFLVGRVIGVGVVA